MDHINRLCDELLQEIFKKLPNSSSSSSPSSSSSSSSSSSLAVSLVSKRWLHLYRTSRTSLSLHITLNSSTVSSLSTILSHYPFLSSLSLFPSDDPNSEITTVSFNNHLLFIVSCFWSKLKHLRFLVGPVSASSFSSLSYSCKPLTSLTVSLCRPLFFGWVEFFSCLKELSVSISGAEDEFYGGNDSGLGPDAVLGDAELGLETLSLAGIRRDDTGVGWLWRSCKKLRKLQLKRCEGVGDGGSFFSFIRCLQGLQKVELRTCRSIVDEVLAKLAQYCDPLNSLLVYDGGSREGLLDFIRNCRCNLQKLDLRLPLDLKNDHLSAVAMKFGALSTLRLQSCCLVTGEGLKALGIAMSSGLEDLALIHCDVVERESGLLATLGQHFRNLKKLDLSHNELLLDKELMSMLVSCNSLIELKLRGCRGLTGVAMVSLSKSCKRLETIDIRQCRGIEAEAIESFILNSRHLSRFEVEESKLSDVARALASSRFIEVAN